jgi:Trk K+ transport system NAD-binding subunit
MYSIECSLLSVSLVLVVLTENNTVLCRLSRKFTKVSLIILKISTTKEVSATGCSKILDIAKFQHYLTSKINQYFHNPETVDMPIH